VKNSRCVGTTSRKTSDETEYLQVMLCNYRIRLPRDDTDTLKNCDDNYIMVWALYVSLILVDTLCLHVLVVMVCFCMGS